MFIGGDLLYRYLTRILAPTLVSGAKKYVRYELVSPSPQEH